MSRARHRGLDGLRGLAALVVFAGHALKAPRAPLPSILEHSPLHALFDGTAAVDLFFVLSGFVLALPFVGDDARPLQLRDFWRKRVLRIYPAYWAALAIALLLQRFAWAPPIPGASAWLDHFWATPPTLHELAAHAVMIGPSFDWARLDPVIWSLIVEMRLSLVYPFVIFLLARVARPRSAALLLFAAVVLALIPTLNYLPLFVLGGITARFRAPLFAWVRQLSNVTIAIVAVAAVIAFDARFAFGVAWAETPLAYRLSDYVIALGSLTLVVLVAARPSCDAFFARRPLAFAGDVSYGFYLVHFPILLATVSLVGHVAPAIPLALAASLAIARILHVAVEKPFMALGRTLARPEPMLMTHQC
jgi:peptidoglycan/LPS O-acetylase OafA/YrhL